MSISTAPSVNPPDRRGQSFVAAFDGAHMWVPNSDDSSVSVFNPDGTQVAGSPFLAGTYPDAIAFDGAHMWLVNDVAAGTVTVLNIDGTPVTGSPFAAGRYPYGLAFDGANMWVTNSGDNTVSKFRIP